MFLSSKRRRRGELLAEPFPAAWLDYLKRNVRQYALLSAAEQSKLRDRTRIFVAEKQWVGCGGLAIDEEMKVAIAAQACLLVLGLPHEYYYDRIRTVLVYPDTYLHPPDMNGGWEKQIAGEYWHRGPVIVSWKNTRDGMDDRGNLVFHEFAHHLDDIGGEMDGMPPLENAAQERRWLEVVGEEYDRLTKKAQQGEATLLSYYGAKSLAEFFAVATECFFERPVPLEQQHPELYGILRDFYRQDPARWPWRKDQQDSAPLPGPDNAAPDDEDASVEETVRAMRLKMHGADAYFTRGSLYADAGNYERAVAAFDEALRLNPKDGEAYHHRAAAKLWLHRDAEAIADADAAIRLDPDDIDAYVTRATAYLGTEQYQLALDDMETFFKWEKPNGEDFRLRGVAKAGLRDLKGALADYNRAIRNSRDSARAYLCRSYVYEDLGMPHEARADRDMAYRLDPSLRDGA